MQGFFPSSSVLKEQPVGLLPKCGACGLLRGCNTPQMRPHGKGRKRILIVGEFPGESEDAQGRPFVGRSGQFLRQSLNRIGIDLDEDAWSTNSLICHPGKKGIDPRMIRYCRPNLLKTLDTLQPRVVITLGRYALSSVLQDVWKKDIGSLERWIGWRVPLLGKYWICPLFHPSYLSHMNNDMLTRFFEEQLEAACSTRKDVKPLPDWSSLIECQLDEKKVCRALEEIEGTSDWIAYDYETTCIKPEWPLAEIVSCAVSNGRRTIAYPWVGKNIEATGSLLLSSKTRKIASNLKMEQRWTIKQFGKGTRNWGWDTMLATHALDNRQDICSLKFQALVRLGVAEYNSSVEPYLKNVNGPYNRIKQIDKITLLHYNGMDALLEWRLARVQRRDMHYED